MVKLKESSERVFIRLALPLQRVSSTYAGVT